MGEAIEWSFRELAELLLRLIIVLSLVGILAGIIKIFTTNRPIEPEITDFNRITYELMDLKKGETIKVPVFANDYSIFIVSSKKSLELNLNCRLDEGNYCACVKKNDAILKCKSIQVDDEIKNKEVNIKGNYITLTHSGVISLI